MVEIQITEDGYLRLHADVAASLFPGDALVAMANPTSLMLLPTRGPGGGGLVLKQRNLKGDRSVLLAEVFNHHVPAGTYNATWDATKGLLAVDLGSSVNVPHPAFDDKVLEH